MPRSKATDEDNRRMKALRERLAVIAQRYSQAEIARRAGAPTSNVSRYLDGTRMPADFASALVEGLGVNPAWLLTGEGVVWLADVTTDTSRMAGDVLDLVKAMTAVSRMKLGELAGKRHLGVLRELDDALRAYESSRAQLNKQTQPIFEEFLDQHRDAIKRGQLQKAEDLVATLKHVSRLCDDEALAERFAAQIAIQKVSFSDPLDAVPALRDVFKSRVFAAKRCDSDVASAAVMYIVACTRVGLLGEGRKAAAIALGMADGAEPEHEALVHGALAAIEIRSGELREGLKRAAECMTRVRPELRHQVVNAFVGAMLMSGNLDLPAAFRVFPELDVRAHVFVPFAAWLEDRKLLETVCRDHIGDGLRMKPDSFEASLARAVLAALKGDRATVAEFLEQRVAARRRSEERLPGNFESHVAQAQMLRLSGDAAAARKALLPAIERLAAMPAEFTPSVAPQAIHARNVLVLVHPGTKDAALRAERDRVEVWVKSMLDKGYAFLSPLG